MGSLGVEEVARPLGWSEDGRGQTEALWGDMEAKEKLKF